MPLPLALPEATFDVSPFAREYQRSDGFGRAVGIFLAGVMIVLALLSVVDADPSTPWSSRVLWPTVLFSPLVAIGIWFAVLHRGNIYLMRVEVDERGVVLRFTDGSSRSASWSDPAIDLVLQEYTLDRRHRPDALMPASRREVWVYVGHRPDGPGRTVPWQDGHGGRIPGTAADAILGAARAHSLGATESAGWSGGEDNRRYLQFRIGRPSAP